MTRELYGAHFAHSSMLMFFSGLALVFGARTTSATRQHQLVSGSMMLPPVDEIFPGAVYTMEPVAFIPPQASLTSSSTFSGDPTDLTTALSNVPSLRAPSLTRDTNFINDNFAKDADNVSQMSKQFRSNSDSGYHVAAPTAISSLTATSNYGDVFFSPAAAYANTLFFPSLASVMGSADAATIPFSPAFLHQPQQNAAPQQEHHYSLPLFSPTTSSATLTFDPAAFRPYYDPTPAASLVGQSNDFFTSDQRPVLTPTYPVTKSRPPQTTSHQYAQWPSTYQLVTYDASHDPHYWTSLPPSTSVQKFPYSPIPGKQAASVEPLTQYYWLPNGRAGHFMQSASPASAYLDETNRGPTQHEAAVQTDRTHIAEYPPPPRSRLLNNNAQVQHQAATHDGNLFGRTEAFSIVNDAGGSSFMPRFTSPSTSPVADAFVKQGIAEALGFAVPPAEAVEVMYKSAKGIVLFGNELQPSQTSDEPPFVRWPNNHRTLYTLMMLDLDAPSAVNSYQRPLIHWIVVNIPGNLYWLGKTLVKYIGPNPLPGTGEHRYVFLVYEQPEFIDADEPVIPISERTARMNFRLSDFVVKYNLIGPLAGNFFLSSHAKKMLPGTSNDFRNTGNPDPATAGANEGTLASEGGNYSPPSLSANGFNTVPTASQLDGNKYTNTDFHYDRNSAREDSGRQQGSSSNTQNPNYYYGRSLKAKQDVSRNKWQFEPPPALHDNVNTNKLPLQEAASGQETAVVENWEASRNEIARRIPVTA